MSEEKKSKRNFDHLETFNVAVGVVFDYFLSQFPVRNSCVDIYPWIEKKLKPIIEQCDKDGGENEFKRVAGKNYIKGSNIPPETYVEETVSWLKVEGFLHEFGSGKDPEYQLSSKTLAVLNAMPGDLTEKLGAKLSDAVKDAGTAAGRSMISETVGQIIGAAARSFTGG